MILEKSKRVSFKRSEAADVIVFDTLHLSLIKLVIPSDLSVGTFKTRPVEINLSVKLLFYCLLNLKFFSLKDCLQSKRGFFYKTFWQLQMIYILSELQLRKPRALISNIDNSNKFAWLSKNFDKVQCIGIQNGFRASSDVDSENAYYCNHLFCFGDREVLEFPKFGYKVDHFHPVGSLLLERNFKPYLLTAKPTYDLLIVSCWRGNIGFGQDVSDSMKAMRVMDELLADYLSQRKLVAGVILRSERESDDWIMPEIGMSEEQYYQSIYGESLKIIDVNFAERNVYPTMQLSNLIVAGHITTCLVEAMAMGKKILYANFTGSDKYHLDYDPNIVFTGHANDKQQFFNRLDELQKMSDAEFGRKNEDILEYYVLNPNTYSTRQMIKAGISEILKLKSVINGADK